MPAPKRPHVSIKMRQCDQNKTFTRAQQVQPHQVVEVIHKYYTAKQKMQRMEVISVQIETANGGVCYILVRGMI